LIVLTLTERLPDGTQTRMKITKMITILKVENIQ
jgi:hypothetical protein